MRRPMWRLPRATSKSSAWTSRWRRRRAATSPWRSCCPIRLISRSSARNRPSTFRTAIHRSRFRSSAGSRQPTASCWSGARRSPNLTGACSRARRSWASGPAARRCFLEAALRQNGLDPQKDVKLMNNVGIPARVGSWLAGQNQYAIFIEPDASQLELDGKAHFLASIGETVGLADYTTFMATDKYIRENKETLQNWTNGIAKGMKWTAETPVPELVKTLEQF